MSQSIQNLAEKVWKWRKENGYLKSLPKEIRHECCEVIFSGEKQTDVAKAIGVSPKSVFLWFDRYKSEKEITKQFIEIKDPGQDEQSLPNINTRFTYRCQPTAARSKLMAVIFRS